MDEVNKAFAQWLLQEFIQENNDNFQIKFGKGSNMFEEGLILSKGQFTFKKGFFGKETSIAFSDVTGLKQNRTGGGWLLGPHGKKGKPQKITKFAGNATALSLIMQVILAQKQEKTH